MVRPLKWKNIHLLDAYEYAKQGMSDTKIAEAIGVSETTFDRWKFNKPELKEALTRARKSSTGTVASQIAEFIYDQLPTELQHVWERLMMLDNVDNGCILAETLLDRHGKHARQRLFLHAIVYYNFNQSLALKRVGISKTTLDRWMGEADFGQLMQEIPWHMGNLGESCLIERMKEGSEPCTIFFNKTFNRKRGYEEKVAITNETEVNIKHSYQIDVSQLDLAPDVLRAILEAMRRKKERDAQLALPSPTQTIQPSFSLPNPIIEAEVIDATSNAANSIGGAEIAQGEENVPLQREDK